MEEEMKILDLWEQVPPSDEALSSTMPFCYDTLEFTQWIQWLFIPRLRALLEGELALPKNSSVHELAEMSFKELEQDTDHLLVIIAELDDVLNSID